MGERDRLPEASGIYVIADSYDQVWYVGKAQNLRLRWLGKGHHRYAQLMRKNKTLRYRIYWTLVSLEWLQAKEVDYINAFKPALNGSKVKPYLPQKPQAEQEMKRLLRVLNRLTSAFPVVRSVVVGQYTEANYLHFLLVVNLHDCILLSKSRNQRAIAIRQAWSNFQSYCGRDEQTYRSMFGGRLTAKNYCLDFLVIPKLIFFLEQEIIQKTAYLETVELLGVGIKTLPSLSMLDGLKLREESMDVDSAGRRSLFDVAYLQYQRNHLSSLTHSGNF
ncbi:MAG: GIY-YIG nuclease family protein [Kaiparowitsia implicata GSE-PSE-MK54-09C]|nr:GIY-YIG nuclease family protein [Kaiparowitsia implicata GSE-PSE-MK54-09C]